MALAALACCLGACQPMATMMSPPLALRLASNASSPAKPTHDSRDRVTLLYATTRQPSGPVAARRYGEDVSDELRLGVAILSVDERAGAPDLRALPTLSGMRKQPALRLENLDERATLDAGADLDVLSSEAAGFFAGLDDALSASADKDVFVYVHGANNGVYRTAAQAAQYGQFTGRDSVVVAFAWPTVDNYLSYATDVGNAKRSVLAFARLIELLARHTRAEHINIMAHSAGARIVSAALASMGRAADTTEREILRQHLRLGEVYYAAADIEIRTFVRELADYVDLPLRTTLQTNRDDLVLAYLGFRSGHSRAGRPDFNDLNEAEHERLRAWAAASRLDIIDVASERSGDFPTGHAFWYERRWVSSDVLVEFTYHAPPAARGLQETGKDGLRRWAFPPDYEQRAATAVGNLGLR
jgi:esterase/lipase superfamily enzyme